MGNTYSLYPEAQSLIHLMPVGMVLAMYIIVKQCFKSKKGNNYEKIIGSNAELSMCFGNVYSG